MLLTRQGRILERRRGVILLVVLAMLTLFAILGIAFVIYAEAAANEARLAREGEHSPRPDVDPAAAFAMFLGQLIYDVPDPDGTTATSWAEYSALRGHSLARNMYGWNNTTGVFDRPYCGPGRLNESGLPAPFTGTNASTLVNYTPFINASTVTGVTKDSVMRDPERLGTRASFTAARGTFLACNVPYTYPDQENLFLAAVKADGTFIAPSFHRPWVFGTALTTAPAAGNPWETAVGKYLTLRPREFDQRQVAGTQCNFPYPDEDGGDVKNLTGFPGGNDSIWIDIDAPVQISPDGRKFKMLVAPLILDLDNRVNLNTAGNILVGSGSSATPASNQGWGPWEVNPTKVLPTSVLNFTGGTPEWIQIITGGGRSSFMTSGSLRVYGKYGKDGLPSGTGVVPGNWPPGYAQVDYNAIADPTTLPPAYSGALSTNFLLPGAPGSQVYQTFPTFPTASYNNGNQTPFTTSPPPYVESTSHPLSYNVMRTNANTGDDRVLGPYHMSAVLRYGGTNPDSQYSDLLRLLPTNLAKLRTRNMVTVASFDLDRPGVLPYAWLDGNTANNYTLGTSSYPSAGALAFPTSTSIATLTPGTTEFDASGRSLLAALGKIDLNRTLTNYPFTVDTQIATTRRFDTTSTLVTNQIAQANADRQQFATDIFNALLIATGAQYSQDAGACQWLAQLAVNIVDYIDTDDIMTVFTYTVPGTAITGTVYGTELPRLVINEAFVQWDNNPADVASNTLANPYNVNVSVELYNTMVNMPGNSEPTAAAPATGFPSSDDGVVVLQNDQGPVYQLVLNDIANVTAGFTGSNLFATSNVLGDPDSGAGVCGNATTAPFQPFDNVSKGWGTIYTNGIVPTGSAPAADQIVRPSAAAINMAVPPTVYTVGNPMGTQYPGNPGWYTVGPITNTMSANCPYLGSASPPMDPALSLSFNTAAMTYTVPFNLTTPASRPTPTIMLRRLANPYLAYNASTNPYVTVDMMQTTLPATAYDATDTAITVYPTQDDRRVTETGVVPPANVPQLNQRMSWGRRQPYAGLSGLYATATGISSAGTYTQLQPQIPHQINWTLTTQARNTFFSQNTPNPSAAYPSATVDTVQVPFDWLVHLDRQLISPMELSHVSGFRPQLLTQQFVQPNPASTAPTPAQQVSSFGQVARWSDPATRLARAFEVFATKCRSNGVAFGGRTPGRVNLNTLWDKEPFEAVSDAQPPNMFYDLSGLGTTDYTVDNIFGSAGGILPTKTPSLPAVSANDRPFLGMAVGAGPGTADELPYNSTNAPARGVDYTLLAAFSPPTTSAAWNNIRLMEPNDGAGNPYTPNSGMTTYTNFAQHPYQRSELLRKAYNNLTCRSNVFGVWLTIGFFEVTNDTVRPVQLGAEIGKSENRQIRHHMFAIVDRTNLQIWPTVDPSATTPGAAMIQAGAAVTVPAATMTTPAATYTTATISLVKSDGVTATTSATNPYTGYVWNLGANQFLTYEPDTDNEETVVVQSGSTARFFKSHPANCAVISRGNPGPWQRYDPRKDMAVVPYFAVID